MVPVAYLPYFFNPTLNIKMVFGEKIPKMGTFSDLVTIFFVKCYNKILIISLPTYSKFCWYATGTTHIFHLGLIMIHIVAESFHIILIRRAADYIVA